MPETGQFWIARWLDAVAQGSTKMSQRRVSSIEQHGGVAAAISAAKARGVHLVKLTDDHGNVLVAASLQPFEPLC